jgi:hypothetical protein
MDAHGLAYRLNRSARGTGVRALALSAALAVVSACAIDSEEPQDGFDAATTVPDAALAAPGVGARPTGGTGGTAGSGSAAGGSASGTATMAGGIGALGGGIGGLGDSGITVPPFGRDAGGARDAGVVDAGPPAPVGDGGPDQYAEVRQVCVDTINMYRATRNLPPLMRADATREACSDEGAKYDGDLNRGRPANQVQGHQSTSNRSASCRSVGFGSQNTCPNWGVGGRTGNATLADAIKRCLAQMWAEGEPPIPVEQCKMDQSPGGCFLTHGHWINMTAARSVWVACGFYNVQGGTYWMNQDFD